MLGNKRKEKLKWKAIKKKEIKKETRDCIRRMKEDEAVEANKPQLKRRQVIPPPLYEDKAAAGEIEINYKTKPFASGYYSTEIVDYICENYAKGMSIPTSCQDVGIYPDLWYKWKARAFKGVPGYEYLCDAWIRAEGNRKARLVETIWTASTKGFEQTIKSEKSVWDKAMNALKIVESSVTTKTFAPDWKAALRMLQSLEPEVWNLENDESVKDPVATAKEIKGHLDHIQNSIPDKEDDEDGELSKISEDKENQEDDEDGEFEPGQSE